MMYRKCTTKQVKGQTLYNASTSQRKTSNRRSSRGMNGLRRIANEANKLPAENGFHNKHSDSLYLPNISKNVDSLTVNGASSMEIQSCDF